MVVVVACVVQTQVASEEHNAMSACSNLCEQLWSKTGVFFCLDLELIASVLHLGLRMLLRSSGMPFHFQSSRALVLEQVVVWKHVTNYNGNGKRRARWS